MSLYDDLDTTKQLPESMGIQWGSSIKMLQSQLAIKNVQLAIKSKQQTQKPNFLAKPLLRPHTTVNIIQKKEESLRAKSQLTTQITTQIITANTRPSHLIDYDWEVVDEYDPFWPNDYEKVIKDKRERNKDRDRKEKEGRKKHKNNRDSPVKLVSGFGGRPSSDNEDDEEADYRQSNTSFKAGGAMIAPPKSLINLESAVTFPDPKPTYGAGISSTAAKIMARYGFKDGEGLGKAGQGISMALQVQKTSKRGGRIIHEKDLVDSPPYNAFSSPVPATFASPASIGSTVATSAVREPSPELTITEIMRAPSKVVLLRNMVGPSDVDSDLEPEVKDECTKYGDVITVMIREIPIGSIRIFVEFKRIESAIKAVVDLNGRFFGGRQVRAEFYNCEKFENLMLND